MHLARAVRSRRARRRAGERSVRGRRRGAVASGGGRIGHRPSAGARTEPVRPPGFACGDKELTGSGPGFDSSREHSQETAKADWLAKAHAIYTDASWETAKELSVTCAQQGLYSKCFASAIPCGVQKSSAAAEPPAKSN